MIRHWMRRTGDWATKLASMLHRPVRTIIVRSKILAKRDGGPELTDEEAEAAEDARGDVTLAIYRVVGRPVREEYEDEPPRVTTEQVAEKVGLPVEEVAKELAYLLKKKLIRRDGDGQWYPRAISFREGHFGLKKMEEELGRIVATMQNTTKYRKMGGRVKANGGMRKAVHKIKPTQTDFNEGVEDG